MLDDRPRGALVQPRRAALALKVGELKKKGMTFITEKEGLKVDEFRKGVAAEVAKDFPTWKPYLDRISAIK